MAVLTFNRFEVKYVAPLVRFEALLASLRDHLVDDPHGGADGYPVYSVYYDTPDLLFYREKVEGLKMRRKLRVRRYDIGSNVYAEIKQRVDRTVQKRRAPLPDATLPKTPADWARIASNEPGLEEAALLAARHALQPTMATAYRRRALFAAADTRLRVTLDRRVQAHPRDFDLQTPMRRGIPIVADNLGILEIKYDDRVPRWLTSAMSRTGLAATRISKYCTGVHMHFYASYAM